MLPLLGGTPPLSPPRRARETRLSLVDESPGGWQALRQLSRQRREGTWSWSPLRIAPGVKTQPLAGSERLSLGLGLFLLAGGGGDGPRRAGPGRAGPEPGGLLVLGLPSPPRVLREQGEGAGIQPSSPFPPSESSAWHRGAQAGQLQLQPRNPERLAWGRITWAVGARPACPPTPPQPATQPARPLQSSPASGHQAGPPGHLPAMEKGLLSPPAGPDPAFRRD